MAKSTNEPEGVEPKSPETPPVSEPPKEPKETKPPKETKEAKEPKPKEQGSRAAVASVALKKFTVHIPKDNLAPKLTVEAQTAGDAERVYREQAGIIASEHPLSVSPAE